MTADEHGRGDRRRDRRRARRARHRGADPAQRRSATSASSRRCASSRTPSARPHPYVVGINLAGDEAGYPPGPFAEAYAVAAAAGLGCTVHAGEWAGPGVRPRRARAAGHADLPRRAGDRGPGPRRRARASRGIVLECCPTSNVVLGVFDSYEAHPLPALREAGVRVTLGSDDPPYFGASVGGEYAVAHERFGLGRRRRCASLTRTAIEASFAEPALREALLARSATATAPGRRLPHLSRTAPPAPSRRHSQRRLQCTAGRSGRSRSPSPWPSAPSGSRRAGPTTRAVAAAAPRPPRPQGKKIRVGVVTDIGGLNDRGVQRAGQHRPAARDQGARRRRPRADLQVERRLRPEPDARSRSRSTTSSSPTAS